MTVAELIAKLQAMVTADPSVAELEVDADGGTSCEPVEDVRETTHGYQPGERRVFVARDPAP